VVGGAVWGCSVVGVGVVLQPSGKRVRRMRAVFFIGFLGLILGFFRRMGRAFFEGCGASPTLATIRPSRRWGTRVSWLGDICGGLEGSLELEVPLLRLDWRVTGALVFD
jgi:hypothetical protein